MTADMMCITDLDGKKLAGDRDPSSEMQMHLEVYRQRPDVQAVVHAHPPIATGFAVAGIPLDRAVLAEVVTTLGQRADRRVRDAVDEGAARGGAQVRQGARRHAARQPRRADARRRPVRRLLQDGDDRALRQDQPGGADARRRAAAVARGSDAARRGCAASYGIAAPAPICPPSRRLGDPADCQVVQAPVSTSGSGWWPTARPGGSGRCGRICGRSGRGNSANIPRTHGTDRRCGQESEVARSCQLSAVSWSRTVQSLRADS